MGRTADFLILLIMFKTVLCTEHRSVKNSLRAYYVYHQGASSVCVSIKMCHTAFLHSIHMKAGGLTDPLPD
jgi:hypothetical protein